MDKEEKKKMIKEIIIMVCLVSVGLIWMVYAIYF